MVDSIVALRRGQVDADQLVVVLDDLAVDEHGVHVAAAGLVDDVAVRVQHREADRRVVVLDQHQVGLLADLDAADRRVEAEGLRAAPGGVVHHVLGAQEVVGEGLVPCSCASSCSLARSALSVARIAANMSPLHQTLVSLDSETGMPYLRSRQVGE